MNTTIALVIIGAALFVAAISIPLICRKIPMNPLYGVRLPQAFKSEKNWYEINEYGGKAMLISTVPMFLVALSGLVFSTSFFPLLASLVVFVSVVTPTVVSYRKAKIIDRNNDHESDS